MTTAFGAGMAEIAERPARRASRIVIARRWLVVSIAAALLLAVAPAARAGEGAPPAASPSPSASPSASPSPAASPSAKPAPSPSRPDASCAGVDVKQLVSRAEQQFQAGFPVAALALVSRALVCKPDDRMYLAATIYACMARDAMSAQWYFLGLPEPSRRAAAQRCQQQRIALLDPWVGVVRPVRLADAAAPDATQVASAGPALLRSGCSLQDVENLGYEARSQFRAGFAKAALFQISEALACRPDPQTYRTAAMFACAAHEPMVAKLYASRLDPQGQQLVNQRCQLDHIDLLGALPAGSQPAPPPTSVPPPGAPVWNSLGRPSIQLAALSSSARPADCDAVEAVAARELAYRAAERFMAGNARAALGIAGQALVCKHDRSMLRMAVIYACVAHDDVAQRYYHELPRHERAAVRQRCAQEDVWLVEAPAAQAPAAPGPVRARAASRSAVPSSCSAALVDGLVTQAANQFAAGSAPDALAIVAKALACRQDAAMYQVVAEYACAAHDLAGAKRYVGQLPALQRGPVVLRCARDGLDITEP